MLRGHYTQVFYVVVTAYIAVAKSQLLEKKAWHSGTPYLEIQPSTLSPQQPRAMQLLIGQQIGCAIRMSNEGIAFFCFFLWACCHDIAARQLASRPRAIVGPLSGRVPISLLWAHCSTIIYIISTTIDYCAMYCILLFYRVYQLLAPPHIPCL